MSNFKGQLTKYQPNPEGRRWLFIPYDQLSDAVGPLSREDPSGLGIVLVKNPWKAARRPYHKQKLAIILSDLRHFVLEQARIPEILAREHGLNQGVEKEGPFSHWSSLQQTPACRFV